MTVSPASHHQERVNVVPEMEGMSGVLQCTRSAAALPYGLGLPDPNLG